MTILAQISRIYGSSLAWRIRKPKLIAKGIYYEHLTKKRTKYSEMIKMVINADKNLFRISKKRDKISDRI